MKRAAFAALASLILLAPAAVSGQESVAPNIGHRLPPLQFTDLAGVTHRNDWSSAEPKTWVIAFFEPRCADCFRELVFLDSVSRLARGLSLEVFAVEGSGQEPWEVEATISRLASILQRPAFTVVPDPNYALSKTLNVQRMPSTFLLETRGLVIGRKEGFDNLHAIDLARKMERLLAVKRGTFSPALVSLGITAQEELAYEKALEGRRRAEDSGSLYSSLLTAGATVPPFEFVDSAGGRGAWSPAGREGKATVVFFWGALCQPCIREMAHLEQLRSVAGGSALDVIAVEATGLAPERVSQVMERYKKFNPLPSYPIVADPDRKLSRHFGVGASLPQTFIVSGDGTVLYHTDEFVQEGERRLDEKIERALGLKAGTLSQGVARSASAPGHPSSEEAPTVLRKLSSRSEEFMASLTQAETLYRNWQYIAAIPHYRRCLDFDPQSVAVRERLADIFQRQGELGLALEQWEKIVQIDPANAEAARRAEKLRKGAGPKTAGER